jgi:hypothetical protein
VRGCGKMPHAIASTTFAEGFITQGRTGRDTKKEEGREAARQRMSEQEKGGREGGRSTRYRSLGFCNRPIRHLFQLSLLIDVCVRARTCLRL